MFKSFVEVTGVSFPDLLFLERTFFFKRDFSSLLTKVYIKLINMLIRVHIHIRISEMVLKIQVLEGFLIYLNGRTRDRQIFHLLIDSPHAHQ